MPGPSLRVQGSIRYHLTDKVLIGTSMCASMHFQALLSSFTFLGVTCARAVFEPLLLLQLFLSFLSSFSQTRIFVYSANIRATEPLIRGRDEECVLNVVAKSMPALIDSYY